MMSHMASPETLADEARRDGGMRCGTEGLIVMDSAGAYLPADVVLRISTLVNALSIPV